MSSQTADRRANGDNVLSMADIIRYRADFERLEADEGGEIYMVECVKFGKRMPGLPKQPLKGDMGSKVYAEVSADGTMGWVISRMAVTRSEPDDAGGRQTRSFTYAGIMTYEKVGGKWLKVANVSTFAP